MLSIELDGKLVNAETVLYRALSLPPRISWHLLEKYVLIESWFAWGLETFIFKLKLRLYHIDSRSRGFKTKPDIVRLMLKLQELAALVTFVQILIFWLVARLG